MSPDLARMVAWLERDPLAPDGSVLSWVNPEHPGYAYPEAAGLLLGLLSDEGRLGPSTDRIALRLTSDASGCAANRVALPRES